MVLPGDILVWDTETGCDVVVVAPCFEFTEFIHCKLYLYSACVNKPSLMLYYVSASDPWDCYTGVRSKATGDKEDFCL